MWLRAAWDADWRPAGAPAPIETETDTGDGDDDNVYNSLSRFLGETVATQDPAGPAIVDQLAKYLAMPDESANIDILVWWRKNKHLFPDVARMARQFLACPATSAGVERMFSKAGRNHKDLQKRAKDGTLRLTMLASINKDL